MDHSYCNPADARIENELAEDNGGVTGNTTTGGRRGVRVEGHHDTSPSAHRSLGLREFESFRTKNSAVIDLKVATSLKLQFSVRGTILFEVLGTSRDLVEGRLRPMAGLKGRTREHTACRICRTSKLKSKSSFKQFGIV